jgi:phosphatidylserine/phosphatidylglycerophosphate/cardiolipin synthase-like enzyme
VQESVWIQAQYVGDEEVVERLSQLQDSGIDVRVLV